MSTKLERYSADEYARAEAGRIRLIADPEHRGIEDIRLTWDTITMLLASAHAAGQIAGISRVQDMIGRGEPRA
jgi:hypothetical protein